MNQNEATDHWATLAAELGARPASEPPGDKPGDQATPAEAPPTSQSAIAAPAAAAADDSQQQAASALSSASAGQPASPQRAADTHSAARPEPPAVPATPPTQTKSSWDILAEQLGIPAVHTAEPRRTDVPGTAGVAAPARQAEGPGVLAVGEGAAHRPSGGRPRRQPTPMRFGEGIFDEKPSADALHCAGALGEEAKPLWQPAESPQAVAGGSAGQIANLPNREFVVQEPGPPPSAQRPDERKSGRRRRKKRGGQESAPTAKLQTAFDAPAAASGCHAPEASEPQSEPSQDWREQIEVDQHWQEAASAEQRATHPIEQVAAAEETCTVPSTEGYGTTIENEDYARPLDTPEAPGPPETAIAGTTAADAQPAESAASARTESAKHRAIPTWAEAISVIINANLEARARRGDAGRDRRERGGR